MIPDPITAISRNALPIASAARRFGRSGATSEAGVSCGGSEIVGHVDVPWGCRTVANASMEPDMTEPKSTDEPCCGGATTWIDVDAATALAGRLGAVADPTRLQVLSIIANSPQGEVCACDFVGPLEKSQPTISHHLKVLSEAGLIEGERRGRWIWYRLAASGVDSLGAELVRSAGVG